MNNFAGCIEGTTNRTVLSPLREHGCVSDLKSRITAGRYNETDECHIGRQRFGLSLRTVGATSWSGEGYGLLVVSAPDNTAPHYPRNHGNPYIEEGMHTRSQQIFSSRSRMGYLSRCSCEGCSRGPASAFRTFLEAGRPDMKMRSFVDLGRLTKCATPPPISL